MSARRSVGFALALGALGAVLLVSGCGGGGDEGDAAGTTGTTSTSAAVKPITVVSAKLSASEAVPPGPEGATGSATITLNMRSGRACWNMTITGTDKPVSAHVHSGLSGKLGDVVIPLGDSFSRKGCVLSSKLALEAVAGNPAAYYVDIHTTKYIQGAVRGQLRAASA